MRFGYSRFAVALSLFALAPVCAASYVVLLKNPLDVENHVHITNSKGTFGINNPGYGANLNANIRTVQRYEPSQIEADFSYALESMSSILAAGLPPLSHSYVALMKLPQGRLGYLAFDSERPDIIVEKPDQALLIDGYSDEPFMADKQQLNKDFGPALASLDEIIQAGFRPLTYVVLLESPDGSIGKVSVTDARGKVLIDEAGEAVDMGVYLTDDRQFKVEEKAIKEDFGKAIDSRPILPAKYILVFKSGSTAIAPESQEEADRMLADIGSRPAPDITISGHTDTVGNDKYNDKLSQKRAALIAEMIRGKGLELRAVDIDYHGERKLLVKTADNKSELKNRRVEVTVR